MPIMNWSVKRLLEVRGVDTVICVADPKLAEQARKLLSVEEIEVTSIPGPIKTDRNLDNWLASASGPAADADVVLILKPTAPFLPTAKIEAVLNNVVTKAADVSVTTREVDAYVQTHAAGAITRLPVFSEVAACRAFAPARRVEVGLGKFKPVTVDLVESLDVSSPDNLRVATALLATGTL
jgi:2-C-methyl-D-erythritol 4-phosphate cytidylyltransferase